MAKLNSSSIRLALAVGLLGVAGGCGDADLANPDSLDAPQKLARAQQAIKGGEPDSEHHASVGFAVNTGRGMAICSGTLIAPNLVLTARHCVAEVSSEYVICGRSGFGSVYPASALYMSISPNLFTDSAGFVSARKVFVPENGSDMCGYDIALIQLSDNIPSANATPVEPRLDEPVVRHETYTARGYGHTGEGEGTGVRRILEDLRVNCDGADCLRLGSVTPTEWVGDSGTCQGDSGGGAFDSEGRVLGALSRGADGCRSSVYSGVSGWASWIREHAVGAAKDGGYDAPDWADSDNDGAHNGVDNCPDVSNRDQLDTNGNEIGDACDDDIDGDGLPNKQDNCPAVDNVDQVDGDEDGIGDLCDDDVDGDEMLNDEDNCPDLANPEQLDSDEDGVGDACDDDVDGDGVTNAEDNCPATANPDQNADACSDDDGGGGFLGCSTSSPAAPLSGLLHAFALFVLLGVGRVKRRFNRG